MRTSARARYVAAGLFVGREQLSRLVHRRATMKQGQCWRSLALDHRASLRSSSTGSSSGMGSSKCTPSRNKTNSSWRCWARRTPRSNGTLANSHAFRMCGICHHHVLTCVCVHAACKTSSWPQSPSQGWIPTVCSTCAWAPKPLTRCVVPLLVFVGMSTCLDTARNPGRTRPEDHGARQENAGPQLAAAAGESQKCGFGRGAQQVQRHRGDEGVPAASQTCHQYGQIGS